MSNDELPYGEQVICLDTKSPWYLHVGRIRGKNQANVGVAYPEDEAVPATGRWHAKGLVRPVKDVASGATAQIGSLKVRHNRVQRDFTIELGLARHLILTGPNGSGKTTLLQSIADAWLGSAHLDDPDPPLVELGYVSDPIAVAAARALGDLLLVHLGAARRLSPTPPGGPGTIDWASIEARGDASRWLAQYLVNRRTELAFAREDGRDAEAETIRAELDHLTAQIRWMFRDPDANITVDRRSFGVTVELGPARGGRKVGLDQLPSGWGAVLLLWAELMLTEQAWRLNHQRSDRPSGVVLIDELENHLHLTLQEEILGFLTGAFPNWQFIVATHSVVIPSSVPDALVYDLGKMKGQPSSELMGIRYGAIMTGHYGLDDEWDQATTHDLARLRELMEQEHPPAEELAELEAQLSSRSPSLAREIWAWRNLPRQPRAA